MASPRLRVGIVGLQPGRSWGAIAHVPALRSRSEDFEIAGVANTHWDSTTAAARALALPKAFANVAELIADREVDIVTVTVKVPQHFDIVSQVIAAGKHVYCEWPLGNGLIEAQQLAAAARTHAVTAVIGTQARCAPEIEYVRGLIEERFVGDVLSSSIIGSGLTWGAKIDRRSTYLLDAANGATMLSIAFGHTMAAVTDILGPICEVSARLDSRRHAATIAGTEESCAMTAHDQVLVHGLLESGAPISVHFRGGLPRGIGFHWEIHGTEGDIEITGANGMLQMVQLTIRGAQGESREMMPMQVPRNLSDGSAENPIARNVARTYARMAVDLRSGTHTAPSFDDALTLHQLIAAVEESALTGRRVRVAKKDEVRLVADRRTRTSRDRQT